MNFRRSLSIAVAGLLCGVAAHAAIVTSSLNGVSIVGNVYDVTFSQNDNGLTTFDQVFGASPTLTFSSANAAAAAAELLAAVEASTVDIEPGSSGLGLYGFTLFFGYTASSVDGYSMYPNTPDNGLSGIFGPFSRERDLRFGNSIASFRLATPPGTVAEPASVSLLGLVLCGLWLVRRRA